MQIYKNKALCIGCYNCANICPKECITMMPDEKGFLIPQIDNVKCINCGKCKTVCPTYYETVIPKPNKLYAFTNHNTDVLLNSSSGGAFYKVAEKVLAAGGYVCGAVWDNEFNVIHTVTDDIKIIEKMRGSKYLQSSLNDSFVKIRSLLNQEKKVLFCGSPCQVLSLKTFLNKSYQNLITIDFICHNIPSPKVFKAYISMLEKTHGKLIDFKFREKHQGWEDYCLKATFENHTEYLPHKGNLYMELFLDGIINRDCCETCLPKKYGYVSDITLADFWGIKVLNSDLYNRNGVSAIIPNTPKGCDILSGFALTECDLKTFLSINTAYHKTVTPNPKADLFWDKFSKFGFYKAAIIIYKKSFIIRLKTFLKKLI